FEVDDFWSALRLAGVAFGIDLLALERIPVDQPGSHIAARAKPAQRGEDGSLEMLVSPEFQSTLEEDERGHVDFRAAARIPQVNAGDPIARVVDPKPGVPGRTVLGHEIPARNGRSALNHELENVERVGDELVAQIDGLVEVGPRRIAVSPSLIIPGHVDYHSGSIEFHGDVVVGGSVHPGFSVKADGRVLVWGDVDHATIEAGKSVWVRGAVVGPDALVETRESVRARTVYEGRIMARGSIYVEREAKDATLMAGLDITTLSPRGRLYGGTMRAGRQVITIELGSLGEESTFVGVGGDPFGGELLAELQQERAEAYRRLEDVRAQLIPFRARPELAESLDPESRAEIEALGETEGHIAAAVEDLDARIAELDPRGESHARVVARIAMRPGVTVEVRGAKRLMRITHNAVEAIEQEGKVVLEPARLVPRPPPFDAFGRVVRPMTEDGEFVD
ncbi:MAG TPA: FapA family protein, partial [Acidimicrobiia bacterium]|nr:FapA family protein [Acidimicrobiia bacterium]